jgi:hypothetical protein
MLGRERLADERDRWVENRMVHDASVVYPDMYVPSSPAWTDTGSSRAMQGEDEQDRFPARLRPQHQVIDRREAKEPDEDGVESDVGAHRRTSHPIPVCPGNSARSREGLPVIIVNHAAMARTTSPRREPQPTERHRSR